MQEDYERVVSSLLSSPEELKPKVVIVFADRVPAGQLLEAAKRLDIKNKFVWVGSVIFYLNFKLPQLSSRVIRGSTLFFIIEFCFFS